MDRNLRLKTGEPVFNGIFLSDKAIVLGWVAETEVQNIIWMRLITIKWRWPPIKCVTSFTDAS